MQKQIIDIIANGIKDINKFNDIFDVKLYLNDYHNLRNLKKHGNYTNNDDFVFNFIRHIRMSNIFSLN